LRHAGLGQAWQRTQAANTLLSLQIGGAGQTGALVIFSPQNKILNKTRFSLIGWEAYSTQRRKAPRKVAISPWNLDFWMAPAKARQSTHPRLHPVYGSTVSEGDIGSRPGKYFCGRSRPVTWLGEPMPSTKRVHPKPSSTWGKRTARQRAASGAHPNPRILRTLHP